MSQHTIGLIGRKVGMTQVFLPNGTMVGVSVVQVTPNTVTRLRTDERDGYTAVQLGAGERKRLTKPLAGQLKDLPRVRAIREFRLDSADEYEVGQQITVADVFAEGDLVDVTGVSKGKGFAGTIKRHNFASGPKSHGSHNVRAPGSIGASATPSRVFKGIRGPGRMGGKRVTQKGLTIVELMPDRNLMMVRGSVPGSKGDTVEVRTDA